MVGKHSNVPRCAWVRARAIGRPRPAPPESRSRASSKRTNRSNTRSRSGSGIPGPESMPVTSPLCVLAAGWLAISPPARFTTDLRAMRDMTGRFDIRAQAAGKQAGTAEGYQRPGIVSFDPVLVVSLGIEDDSTRVFMAADECTNTTAGQYLLLERLCSSHCHWRFSPMPQSGYRVNHFGSRFSQLLPQLRAMRRRPRWNISHVAARAPRRGKVSACFRP